MILLLPIVTFLFMFSYGMAKLNLAKHQKKLVKVNGKIYEDITPKSKPYSLPVFSMMCFINNRKKEDVKVIEMPIKRQMTKIQKEKLDALTKAFDSIIVEKRTEEIEYQYGIVKKKFGDALKSRKLDRATILGIRKYLSCHVNKFEKKVFKNDAHAIYSMLKAKDLTLEHLEKISEVI